MNKLTLGLITLAVLIGFTAFLVTRTPTPQGVGASPWLEVVTNDVFIEFPGTGQKTTARTGDEIPNGAVVSTSAKGIARVHFPDGSFARLDSDSVLTIETTTFDEATNKLSVKLSLRAGMVWSKVVDLATKDSSWEVQTSQAVAAVRGTAFGTEATASMTRFVGIEHDVDVTHDGEDKSLTPDTEMFITDGDMGDPKGISDEMKARRAYLSFLEEKKAFDDEMQKLRDKYKDDKEFRKQLRKQWLEKFKNNIKQAREDRGVEQPEESDEPVDGVEIPDGGVSDLRNPNDDINPPPPPPTNSTGSNNGSSNGGGSNTTQPVYVRLEITPARPDDIDEGDTINFTAALVLENGEHKDVTTEATWRIVGGAGQFERPGFFRSQLTLEQREFGEIPAGVSVVFTDPVSGKRFENTTSIFKVKAVFEPNPITEG